MNHEAIRLHLNILRTLEAHGSEFAPHPMTTLDAELGRFQCECGKTFCTGQGLALHRAKVHQQYSPEHFLSAGDTCPCCHRYLWSTQRVQQHLKYIPVRLGYNPCYQYLMNVGYHPEYHATKIPVEARGHLRLD